MSHISKILSFIIINLSFDRGLKLSFSETIEKVIFFYFFAWENIVNFRFGRSYGVTDRSNQSVTVTGDRFVNLLIIKYSQIF